MSGMLPLKESYAKYVSVKGTEPLSARLLEEGIYVDAPDSATYHPFMARFVEEEGHKSVDLSDINPLDGGEVCIMCLTSYLSAATVTEYGLGTRLA
jgi:hypothetical protein